MGLRIKHGVYLGCGIARHPDYKIDYVDTDKAVHPTYCMKMEDVDLSEYDFYICTPPCNFWSHATSEETCSAYALETKHLLEWAIETLSKTGKHFIIENVKNKPRMEKYGIFSLARKYGLYVQEVGRHTYFTNDMIDLTCAQSKDFKKGGIRLQSKRKTQGGANVHKVIEKWIWDIMPDAYDVIGKMVANIEIPEKVMQTLMPRAMGIEE